MKIIGITQARIGSSRLPRKVLLEIKGKTLLQYHLERAIQSKMVDKWFVATTQEPESDLICNIASNLSIQSYKGSLNDVLDRFYQIATLLFFSWLFSFCFKPFLIRAVK